MVGSFRMSLLCLVGSFRMSLLCLVVVSFRMSLLSCGFI